MAHGDGASALRRLQQMVATQPKQRPKDFHNPLEKIEELLTCAICLERYKSPKLLPCQHTFCMDPCLDGCVDIVKRILKCPECRAEHSLPFEGVKAFQTNYTLMGFLEIHMAASDETAVDIENYIKRFNLDRCAVCSEKAEVSICVHCDKKVCCDCKQSHMQLLRRDFTRLANQVKRLSSRITEASDGLSKGMEALKLNCTSVKEEMKDCVRKHMRDLKRKEDCLINDIEAFYMAETRLMTTLRDALELESSNINEACARVEAYLKGETELREDEILFFKSLFTEGLEYLRAFHPDADELFAKRLRFTYDTPPGVIHLGDLSVSAPSVAGRWLSMEQTFLPKSFNLGMESDRLRDRQDANQLSIDYRNSEVSSLRQRRRSDIGDQAWRAVASAMKVNIGETVAKSPFARVAPSQEMSGKIMNVKQQKLDAIPSDENDEPTTSDTSLPDVSPLQTVRKSVIASKITRQQSSADDTSLNERIDNIRREHEARKPPIPPSSIGTPIAMINNKMTASAMLKVKSHSADSSDESSEEEHSTDGAVTPIKVTHYDQRAQRGSMQPSKSSNERDDSPMTSSAPYKSAHVKCERDRSKEDSGSPVPGGYDWKKYLIPDPPARTPTTDETKRNQFLSNRSRTNPELIVASGQVRINDYKSPHRFDASAAESRRAKYGAGRLRDSNDSTDNDVHQQRITNAQPGGGSRYRRRGTHQPNSRDSRSQDRQTSKFDYQGKTNIVFKFGTKGQQEGEFNWPRGLALLNNGQEIAVCDSSNHRIQIFNRHGQFQRAIGKYGANKGEFDCLAGITINKNNHIVVTDRYNHRVQIFEAQTGAFLREWGQHGQSNGRFNNPWGVCTDSHGFVYVCDKDNHRVQIFQSDGAYVGKFGLPGNREGQLQNPHFIAANRQNELVVSDTGNHRICIFDSNGHYLSAFGSEGFGEGQFKYPRGVAIDSQGFIIVADSGNNRVQLFDASGRHHATIGSWGSNDGQMKGVEDVAVTDEGKVIVSDRENHRVQIF